MRVTEAEAHGLVICALLGSSMARAYGSELGNKTGHVSIIRTAEHTAGAVVLLSLASVAALVLPDPWGFWIPVGGSTLLAAGAFSAFRTYGFREGFVANLAGVAGVVALVILGNAFLT